MPKKKLTPLQTQYKKELARVRKIISRARKAGVQLDEDKLPKSNRTPKRRDVEQLKKIRTRHDLAITNADVQRALNRSLSKGNAKSEIEKADRQYRQKQDPAITKEKARIWSLVRNAEKRGFLFDKNALRQALDAAVKETGDAKAIHEVFTANNLYRFAAYAVDEDTLVPGTRGREIERRAAALRGRVKRTQDEQIRLAFPEVYDALQEAKKYRLVKFDVPNGEDSSVPVALFISQEGVPKEVKDEQSKEQEVKPDKLTVQQLQETLKAFLPRKQDYEEIFSEDDILEAAELARENAEKKNQQKGLSAKEQLGVIVLPSMLDELEEQRKAAETEDARLEAERNTPPDIVDAVLDNVRDRMREGGYTTVLDLQDDIANFYTELDNDGTPWEDPWFRELKRQDAAIMESILRGAIAQFGAREVSQRIQAHAREINELALRVMYDSGRGRRADEGRRGYNTRDEMSANLVRFANIVFGRGLTPSESMGIMDGMTPEEYSEDIYLGVHNIPEYERKTKEDKDEDPDFITKRNDEIEDS